MSRLPPPRCPAALDARDAEVVGELARAALRPASRATYAPHALQFLAFCEARGVRAVPAAADTVLAFIADQARRGRVRGARVRAVSAAIRMLHMESGFPAPVHPLVCLAFRGWQKATGAAVQHRRRLPLRPCDALRIAWKGWYGGVMDGVERLFARAALVLFQFVFLYRAVSMRDLRVADVRADPGRITVVVRREKGSDGAREMFYTRAELRPQERGPHPFDLMALWVRLQQRRGAERLFPFSYSWQRRAWAWASRLVGRAMGTHAARIGGVAQCLLHGVPPPLLVARGNWAKEDYMRPYSHQVELDQAAYVFYGDLGVRAPGLAALSGTSVRAER